MNENWVNLKSQIVMSNHDQILMVQFATLNVEGILSMPTIQNMVGEK